MHARELAVLASWLAFNSDSLMHSLESKSSIAAQQYWTSFKCRMQRWMNDLRHFEMDARNLEPEHNPWPAAKVVVEEILLSEISDEDLQLIDVGAVFYWNIGYQTNPSGSRTRSSIIRFRRLPVWRFEELSEAQKKAEKTLIALGLT